jgi:hypothetical protein
MLRKALVSALLSASMVVGWIGFVLYKGRRRARIASEQQGPRFEVLLQ